jgi:hypothetical protein
LRDGIEMKAPRETATIDRFPRFLPSCFNVTYLRKMASLTAANVAGVEKLALDCFALN